jgi:hypothetical protein
MSEKALRKLGISKLGDTESPPTKGVLVRLSPEQFLRVKKELQPILSSFGDPGFWRSGGAGSFDPEHRFAKKGTTKIDSGDVDVFVDTDKIKAKLGLPEDADDKTVRAELAKAMSEKFPTIQIGKNVHIGFPVGQEIEGMPAYFQVDLMTMQHAHEIGQHHEHDYSVKDTPYKGVDQQLALASLVNTIPGHPPKTFQYDGFGGALKNRATGEVITRNIDKVAELVLGPGHTADELGNAESIIAAVGGIDSPRLAQFRDDMAKKYPQKKEGTNEWFRSVIDRVSQPIEEDYVLDEGIGDWIEKKMDQLLGNRPMNKYDSMRAQDAASKAPANLPDDVAEKLVADFLAKKQHQAALEKAALAQRTTVEKLKPYLYYFVGNFIERWKRIPPEQKQRAWKDLALGVFRLLMFILEALAKSKR